MTPFLAMWRREDADAIHYEAATVVMALSREAADAIAGSLRHHQTGLRAVIIGQVSEQALEGPPVAVLTVTQKRAAAETIGRQLDAIFARPSKTP